MSGDDLVGIVDGLCGDFIWPCVGVKNRGDGGGLVSFFIGDGAGLAGDIVVLINASDTGVALAEVVVFVANRGG